MPLSYISDFKTRAPPDLPCTDIYCQGFSLQGLDGVGVGYVDESLGIDHVVAKKVYHTIIFLVDRIYHRLGVVKSRIAGGKDCKRSSL